MNFNVSIIIINYNGKDLLKNCLSSLFKFTKDITFEIILIDNNSSESFDDLLKEFHNIKFIKNEKNLGFAAANNQGIKIANGKYILFLNNDTIFTENSIKKVFDFVESLKEPTFIGCQLLNKDSTKQESVVEFPSVWNTFTESFFLYKLFKKSKLFDKYYQNFITVDKPIEVDVIKGAFMFCDAESVKKLNGFDERFFFYSEETDLCYRFKILGGKIYFYPNTSIIHLGNATTTKNLKFLFLNQAKAKIQFFKKNFNKIRFIVSVLIYYLGVIIRIPIYFFGGIFLLNKFLLLKAKYYCLQLLNFPKHLLS